MMRKTTLLRLIGCLWLVFVLTGCDGDTTTNNFGDLPTEPGGVSINLAGRCGAGPSSILCEDISTTNPTGHVENVSMVLRNAAGDTVQTQDLPGGCGTAPTAPCNLEFPGLAPGAYSVTHTVTPDDGGSVARTTYRDLVVG